MFAELALLTLATTFASAQQQAVYCWIGDRTAADIESCTETIAKANNVKVEFSCQTRSTIPDCLALEDEGTIVLMNLDGGDIYAGHRLHGTQPVVSEYYGGEEDAEYYAVMGVMKDSDLCGGGSLGSKLKGANVCSSGYRRSAGWTFPIAHLINENIMQTVSANGEVQVDAQSAVAFFGNMCVPRISDNGPVMTEDGEGAVWEDMCSGCSSKPCDESNTYYDYEGSVECVREGVGDVVFTKHTLFEGVEDFVLLCPDGTCAATEDYAECNYGLVPAHAIVTSKDTYNNELYEDAVEALVAISGDPDWIQEAAVNDVVVDSDAQELRAVDGGFGEFMTTGAMSTYSLFLVITGHPTTICTTSEEAYAFCNEHARTMSEATAEGSTLALYISCMQAIDATECATSVAAGEADLITGIDGGDLYDFYTNEELQLQPIAVESAPSESNAVTNSEYSSVLVVNAEFCTTDVSFASLEGVNACGTGYGRTAGFLMPTSYLVAFKHGEIVNEEEAIANDAETLASFFGDLCVPGFGANMDDETVVWEGLCGMCLEDCEDAEGKYGDYFGAMQGLVDGICDVAFVKHTTPTEYAKENEISLDSYKYLCPSGGCEPADSDPSDRCIITSVPAHTVVTASDSVFMEPEYKEAVVNMFNNPRVKSTFFSTSANPEDLLVEGASIGLEVVKEDNARDFFGDSFDLYKEARAIAAATETAEAAENLSEELAKEADSSSENAEELTETTEEQESSSATLSFSLTAIFAVSFASLFY